MRVGVVVPVRGFAPYLAEALDAILHERPQAVVVVDDASPEPLALHSDHVAQGVRLVRSEQRLHLPGARNRGAAELGEGVDLLAFCDGDDAWEPGSLRARVAALEAAPWAVLAFGRARVVGPDGRETGERWEAPPAGRFADLPGLYRHNPIPVSSVVVRRRAFAGFDESYRSGEDWELWLRLLRGGAAFVCVPDAVIRYRRHPHAMTASLDVLAQGMARLHARHGDAVDPALRDEMLRRDRAGESEGLLRRRRYREARALLPPGRRRALLAVPAVRGLLGRRDPYRRG